MNRLILLFSAVILLAACQKAQNAAYISNTDFLKEATIYASSIIQHKGPAVSYRAGQARTPVWDQAQIFTIPGIKAVLIPLTYISPLLMKTSFGGNHYYNLDNLTQLLIFKDSAGFHSQVLTSLPDTAYLRAPGRSFRGMVWVEDMEGNGIAKYLFDGRIRKLETRQTKIAASIIQNCYTVSGYNYASGDPDGGYYWSEDAGCDYEYIPDLSSTSSGGLTGGNYQYFAPGGHPADLTNLRSAYVDIGNNPIGNVADYLKCFTNVGGSDHQYLVTLAVDQPVPGARVPWVVYGAGVPGSSSGSNPVNAGHTFLIFTEIYGATTITRNIGFYPTKIVVPTSPSAQGMLNNDEGHSYNIAGTFTVDNGQFFNMLSFAQQGNNAGYLYDLNANNCTSFALHTLSQGGIFINSAIGTWTGNGMGNDPGDLGEDLRQQAIPGMTLTNTPNGNPPHPNFGYCF